MEKEQSKNFLGCNQLINILKNLFSMVNIDHISFIFNFFKFSFALAAHNISFDFCLVKNCSPKFRVRYNLISFRKVFKLMLTGWRYRSIAIGRRFGCAFIPVVYKKPRSNSKTDLSGIFVDNLGFIACCLSMNSRN